MNSKTERDVSILIDCQRAYLLTQMKRIANLDESDCERYVWKADAIAVETLVAIECWEKD